MSGESETNGSTLILDFFRDDNTFKALPGLEIREV